MARRRRPGGVSSGGGRSPRLNSTEPERRLWQKLRNRQLGGLKFRRQTPVGPHVADFLCLDAILIVEVDGDTHATSQAEDARRTEFLENEGFRVIRFSNADVKENIEGVLTQTLACALEPSPPQACRLGSLPLPGGEG